MAVESESTTGESLPTLAWLAVLLAAITGLVHLGLGIRDLDTSLGIAFVLAGLGFFGAIALLLLGYRRRLLYLIGIPFVGIQFVLYFAMNWPDVNAIGLGDKVIQVILIALLIVLYRRGG